MRTVGVEEELLLVDPHTGRPVNLASQVIRATTEVTETKATDAGGQVESELQRTMVETQSAVATDLATVREDLVGWRRRTSAAARRQGAALAALATSPVAYDGVITANERYEWMAERFGVTATQVLSCGCHVPSASSPRRRGSASSTGCGAGSRCCWRSAPTPRSPEARTPRTRATAHRCGCDGS